MLFLYPTFFLLNSKKGGFARNRTKPLYESIVCVLKAVLTPQPNLVTEATNTKSEINGVVVSNHAFGVVVQEADEGVVMIVSGFGS